jgi:hypothetical protein
MGAVEFKGEGGRERKDIEWLSYLYRARAVWKLRVRRRRRPSSAIVAQSSFETPDLRRRLCSDPDAPQPVVAGVVKSFGASAHSESDRA